MVLQIVDHGPSWSFKQRQLNKAIAFTSPLSEYAIIFFWTPNQSWSLVNFLCGVFLFAHGANNFSVLEPLDRSAIL